MNSAIPIKLRELEGKTSSTCRAALQLAEELEAGQAETPLSDAFRRFAVPSPAEPLRLALIGLDPTATAEALAALAGHDCNICRVVLTGRLGLTEILLQERGFGVESGGHFQEFDSVEPFLLALQRAGNSSDARGASQARNWLEPVRYKLPGTGGRGGVSILIPDAIGSLVTRPALLSSLADRADWLFVAGWSDANLDQKHAEILQVLASQVLGLQRLVAFREGESPTAGWCAALYHRVSPAPVLLGTPQSAAKLEEFYNPTGALRLITLESRRRRSVQQMLLVQAEEIGQNFQNLQGRKRLYESEAQAGKVSPMMSSGSRRSAEAIRIRLQDDLDATNTAIAETGKRALLPDSPLMVRIRALAEGIESKDLERTIGEDKIKLSLSPEREEQLCGALRELGKAHLMEDLELVHQSLEASVAVAEEEIARATGLSRKFTIDFPDSRALWDSILSLAQPDVRYRGEMAKMTFGARVSSARQSIMALLMAATLLGGSLALFGVPNLRNLLMLASIPLFLAAFAWTFVSFRRQERLALGRETDKLREGFAQELRRVMSDLFREEQTRLGQYFTRTSRELGAQLAEFFRLADEAETRERESGRKQSAELSKNLEGALRTAERRQQECQRLLHSLSEPERAAMTFLEETLQTA